MSIIKAVIPAAGLGTRLFPATKSQPKEMLPLGTKPTIQLVAEELVGAGVRDILIVTGRQKRAIEDHFDPGDGLHPDHKCQRCTELFDTSCVRFFYTRQSHPRGLGDAVAHAREFTNQDHFFVALGDCIIEGAARASLLKRMLQCQTQTNAAAVIAVQTVSLEATRKYGIVVPFNADTKDFFALRDIVEKPGPDETPSQLAVCARYLFSPALYDFLAATAPGHGGEVQLTDAVRSMIVAGLPVYAVPLKGQERRLDVGDFSSYARAFIRLMLTHPELGVDLQDWTQELLQELSENHFAGYEHPLGE